MEYSIFLYSISWEYNFKIERPITRMYISKGYWPWAIEMFKMHAMPQKPPPKWWEVFPSSLWVGGFRGVVHMYEPQARAPHLRSLQTWETKIQLLIQLGGFELWNACARLMHARTKLNLLPSLEAGAFEPGQNGLCLAHKRFVSLLGRWGCIIPSDASPPPACHLVWSTPTAPPLVMPLSPKGGPPPPNVGQKKNGEHDK